MNTGKKIKQKDIFENEKFIKKPKTRTSGQTRYEDEENKHFYYCFVNENTYMNMKMDLYMSNIYSRIILQVIEFYSKICERRRNLRQLTLTQIKKHTNIRIHLNRRQIDVC